MRARKKKIIILICILLAGVILYKYMDHRYTEPVPELAYSQEYAPGTGNIKGDVDVEYFESHGKEFAIGANSQGYAVFKDPRAALDKVCKDYKAGIRLLKRNMPLPYRIIPFRWNCGGHAAYEWGSFSGNEDERKAASFVVSFSDIYQNSFEGDLEADLGSDEHGRPEVQERVVYRTGTREVYLEDAKISPFCQLVEELESSPVMEAEKPEEILCGYYAYEIQYKNGKTKYIFVNASRLAIDGVAHKSSQEICDKFRNFFEEAQPYGGQKALHE